LDLREKAARHNIDKTVGRNIRRFRIARGMSQRRLADELGVTFQQIQKYENGANRVSASSLYALGMTFGLPIGIFFSGLHRPDADYTVECFSSETVEIALKIEALGRRLDVPALWICDQVEELANSLMR